MNILYISSGLESMWVPDQRDIHTHSHAHSVCYLTELLFQARPLCENHLGDMTVTAVTGNPVVEQERKQEVNTAKLQVVLRRRVDPVCGLSSVGAG